MKATLKKKSSKTALRARGSKEVSKIFELMTKGKDEWRHGAYGENFIALLDKTEHERRYFSNKAMWYGGYEINRHYTSEEDLMSETNIIMMDMMRKWEPDKGIENDPYSVYLYINKTVYNELKHYIERCVGGRSAGRRTGKTSRLQDVAILLRNKINPETVTAEEVKHHIPSATDVKNPQKRAEDIRSFFRLYNEAEETELKNQTYNGWEEDESLESSELYKLINKALDPIEQELFRARYIEGNKNNTKAIACLLDIPLKQANDIKRMMEHKVSRIATAYVSNKDAGTLAEMFAMSCLSNEEKMKNETDHTKLW